MTRTFQHAAVFQRLSCLDNVMIGLGRNGVWRATIRSVGAAFDTAAMARRTPRGALGARGGRPRRPRTRSSRLALARRPASSGNRARDRLATAAHPARRAGLGGGGRGGAPAARAAARDQSRARHRHGGDRAQYRIPGVALPAHLGDERGQDHCRGRVPRPSSPIRGCVMPISASKRRRRDAGGVRASRRERCDDPRRRAWISSLAAGGCVALLGPERCRQDRKRRSDRRPGAEGRRARDVRRRGHHRPRRPAPSCAAGLALVPQMARAVPEFFGGGDAARRQQRRARSSGASLRYGLRALSRGWRNGGDNSPARCPAASSRCWRSGGRSSPIRR